MVYAISLANNLAELYGIRIFKVKENEADKDPTEDYKETESAIEKTGPVEPKTEA